MKYPDALELLEKLIRCKSLSNDIPAVNQATAIMKQYLDDHGIYTVVEEYEGRQILFASKKPGKTHKILFNAHLDIVPPSVDNQHEPVIKDGKIIARGASDCLGNAVVIARILVNVDADADVAAIFSADEEIGGFTTGEMVKRGYGPSEMAVICDVSGLGGLAIAQKGIVSYKMVAHGRGGHASAPWCFDNPVITLAEAICKLNKEWTNPTAQNQWGNSIAFTMLNAGFTHNQIPDTAEVMINTRFVNLGDETKIQQQIKDITGLDDVTFNGFCLPTFCSQDNPLVQKLAACIKDVTGNDVRFYKMNGATDARHFTTLDIPIAIAGIDGGGAHSNNEFLVISAIDQGVDAFTNFANTFK